MEINKEIIEKNRTEVVNQLTQHIAEVSRLKDLLEKARANKAACEGALQILDLMDKTLAQNPTPAVKSATPNTVKA